MHIGLDRLPDLSQLQRIRSARLGVLAHPASVDRELTHIAFVLERLGVRPRLFFGPEHGYGGEAQDMASVTSAVDARSGARIVSLYGDRFEDLSPSAEDLAEIDLLLIDLADVGARYYTFVWTALLALRAAHAAGVHVVLLDRPNPISCAPESVEGATQASGFLSFVGLEPVPIRHSLTVGELVALFARREGIPLGDVACGLHVVAVEDHRREGLAAEWDRPFVLPSPNMPTADTALVYPGGCLIEGTNLSEGRGTTRPFEIVGAPWLDGRDLAARLASTGLLGFIARPLTFRPTFQKHAGKTCGGVQIHVTDPRTFRPVATYLALTAFAFRQQPEQFRFRTERYEYVDTIPAFDLLTGSAAARLAIDAGEDPLAIALEMSRPDPAWPEVMREAQAALAAAG
ncbi:exo-beta-N-acetylmuramidase NamZ family protein [Sorangium sp. So ce1078]|uniref:exo-beta-N-acetylmuramidase NamZ family protein n=1 Tax=Sorangium sp. So ce1078 TaxID=3133329 RepID=UPI003F5F18AA